jgi:hypothetical protein
MRQKPRLTLHPLLLIFVCMASHGFVLPLASTSKPGSSLSVATKKFEVMVQMPPTGSDLQANIVLEPILPTPSEIVEVRYKVPFGLNVEPKKGLALCTKDGEGGERVGDILRYTSQWTLGLPRGSGLITQAAAFSGGVSWQCTMFNVLKAKEWQEVVEALLSNEQVSSATSSRSY